MQKQISNVYLAIRPKLCRNCAFPKNFHTRKSCEITVFYAIKEVAKTAFSPMLSLVLSVNLGTHQATFEETCSNNTM